MPFDKWFQDSFNRLILYICITFLYGFIIYAFKDNNQFYGLNKNNDLLDCVFYASIVFTGSGYELDPNTGQNNASFDDVDGGSTTLFSPTFNLLSIDKAVLTYWRWYTNNIGDNGNNDKWVVSVSNNGGASWIDLENTSISNASWVKQRFLLNDHINLTSDVIFKFVAEDVFNTGDAGSGGSLVEAAIDDFLIEYITSGSGIVGDINSDEAVDVLDIVVLVNMVLGFESANFQIADINSDGSVNIQDIILVVNIILN